jgi:hypothetical protein
MWFFVLLAMVGLIASAAAHFSTFAGVDPQELFPYVWLLHIGIFFVVIPAIAIQNTVPRDVSSHAAKRSNFNDAFADAPPWMRTLSKLLFAYMFVNFAIFAFMMRGGSPHREDGRYVLSSHGRVSRQISEEEYHRYRGYEVRGFSGHWMGFYAMGMTLIASGMARRREQELGVVLAPRSPAPRVQTTWFLLPIWAHATVSFPVLAIGFFTGPVLIATLMSRFHGSPFMCLLIIPFFLSGFIGAAIAGAWFNARVAARCPACGGRTYCTNDTGRTRQYTCRDCGHVEG